MYYTDIDKNQHPIGFYDGVKGSFGSLDDDATYKKYAASVFNNTMVFNDSKWNAFTANPDATVLQADPAYATASAFMKNWQGKYLPLFMQFNSKKFRTGPSLPEGCAGDGYSEGQEDVS